MPAEKLTSLADAARDRGLKYSTLYDIVKGGQIEYVVIGSSAIYLYPSALDRYIESRTLTPR
ncbi:MAG: hypothetical protein QF680_03270 [Acidobacteriota bacterium]|jgi:hypothetical protein|nr:hypothetical protein [Acidobacteriota bacterium]